MAGFNNELDYVFPTAEREGTNAFLVSLRPLRAWDLDDTLASAEGRDLVSELHDSGANVSGRYFDKFGRESEEEFGQLKPALDRAFAPMEQLFDARMNDASATTVEKDAVRDEMRMYYSKLFTGMEGYSEGALRSIEATCWQSGVYSASPDEDRFYVDFGESNLGLARVNTACCESIRASVERMNEKYHFFERDDLDKLETLNIYGVDSSKLGIDYQPGIDLCSRPTKEDNFTKVDQDYLDGVVSECKNRYEYTDVDVFVHRGKYDERHPFDPSDDEATKQWRERVNPYFRMEREFNERMAMCEDSVSGQEAVKEDMRKYYGAVFEGLEARSDAGKELINSAYLDADGKVSAGNADDLVYANKGLASANCEDVGFAMESYRRMEDQYHFMDIEGLVQMESRNIYGVKDLSEFIPGHRIVPTVPDYGDNSSTFQDDAWKEDENITALPPPDRSGVQPGMAGVRLHHQLAPLPDASENGKIEHGLSGTVGKTENGQYVAAGLMASSGLFGVGPKGLSGAGSKKLELGGSSSTTQKESVAESEAETTNEKPAAREEKPLDGALVRKRRERMAEMLLSDPLKDQLDDQPRSVLIHDDYQMN